LGEKDMLNKYIKYTDRTIGMFEEGEEVSVILDTELIDIKKNILTLEIEDARQNLIASYSFESEELTLGEFGAGWYRLFLKSGEQRLADQEYIAFTVTVPYANRYKGETCFATDVAGEYEPKTMDLSDEIVRATKLQGFELIRCRANACEWGGQMLDYRKKVYEAGIKTISVAMNGYQAMPKIREKDLRDTYKIFKEAQDNNELASDIVEMVNEPDLMFAFPALPDAIAANCKMACIGVSDSQRKPNVCMPGLALGRDDIYSDILMQNGILEYSPIYNFHGYDQLKPLTAYARKVSMAYAPDGEIRTSYMTENGKKVWCDENEIVYHDHLMAMCNYAVNASSDILADGVDKWFWFISRAFLESGGGFGSYHAWTHQPYPVTATLSNLTHQLCRGKYVGKLANIGDKSRGHLFDTDCGHHVAIVSSPLVDEITLHTNRVTVVDIFGKETVIEGDGSVTVLLGEEPKFLRFDGYLDEVDYYKSEYDVIPLCKLQYTKAQRVVLNALWNDQDLTQSMIMQKGYLLRGGKAESLTLRMYNMNDVKVKGKAHISIEYPEQFEFSVEDPYFEIEPFGEARVNFTLIPKEGFMNCAGDIKFGATLEEIGEAVPAVCRYWFKAEDMPVKDCDIVRFMGVADLDNWNITNIDSHGRIDAEVNKEEESITFHVTHVSGYAQWFFPVYTVQNPEALVDTNGIILRKKNSYETGRLNKLTTFILTKDGRAYWSGHSSAAATSTEWRTVTYPWETFGLYSSPEGLNDIRPLIPSEIVKIRVGVSGTSKDAVPDLMIKDFGAYYDRFGATMPHPEKVTFEGIEEGEICDSIKDRRLTACLPECELDDIRVFVGKHKHDKWTVEGKLVNIDVSNFERGEHVIQVSAKSKTDYRYIGVITFYVK
jgi:hypothetical protein